jgi:hypothetical protein
MATADKSTVANLISKISRESIAMTKNETLAVPPKPNESEGRAIKEALVRQSQIAARVRANVTRTKAGGYQLSSPHSDAYGWQVRLANAFGTCSHEFIDTEIARLASVLRDPEGKIDTRAVDAAMAVIDGAQPQNEIEAMLVIQMAVTHALAMKKASTLNCVNTISQQDSAGLALMRLNRTFTAQVEALASLRRGGKQKMTVEHVHVHPGGQAIVGNVTAVKGGPE